MNEYGYSFDQMKAYNKAKAEKRRAAAEAAKINFEELTVEEAISEALAQHLDNLKVVDLKQILEDYKLVIPNKKKKADIIQGIQNQNLSRISGLIRDILTKRMKIADLKKYLKKEGEPVNGTKDDLLNRLLECKDILDKNDKSAQQPEPALSAKEMGPDVDLLPGEFDSLQPYKCVKKGDDIESIVEGNATIRTLVFDRDLSVKGVDLERILAKVGKDIISIRLGDQETGCSVDNYCAEVIAQHCPRLQSLQMESCNWTDKEAVLVGHCCPRLRYLKISGHDKSSGNLKSAFVSKLVDNRSFLKKLKTLDVVDNNPDYKKMEALNKKRRTLKLVTGDSDSGKWWGSRGQIFEQTGSRMNWY